jgi:hypothetical protein
MHPVTLIQVRFRTDDLAAIDCYRRSRSNPPSRAQAVRELLRRVLIERPSIDGDPATFSLTREDARAA